MNLIILEIMLGTEAPGVGADRSHGTLKLPSKLEMGGGGCTISQKGQGVCGERDGHSPHQSWGSCLRNTTGAAAQVYAGQGANSVVLSSF